MNKAGEATIETDRNASGRCGAGTDEPRIYGKSISWKLW
jgi:hypothetical protein